MRCKNRTEQVDLPDAVVYLENCRIEHPPLILPFQVTDQPLIPVDQLLPSKLERYNLFSKIEIYPRLMEIGVAVESPQPGSGLLLRYGLVGLYVGIIPVLLGMLWYPFLRRLSWQGISFVLSLTVGLLLYLAIATWLDAMEFAAELPAFWQGAPMVTLVALITLGILMVVGSRPNRTGRTPLQPDTLKRP